VNGDATRPEGRPSVALVHDYLLTMRGAERTFAAMAEAWPDAPIYTLLYDEEGTDGVFRGREVQTSYLQRLGLRQSGFRALLPLFPRAAERLPVQGYDVVVSSSSAFAHGVRPDPGAVHLSYCHTPFRYAWFEEERALAAAPRVVRPAIRRTLRAVRDWDRQASTRVDRYVANSEMTRSRIRSVWNRDAALVHPPVDVDRFRVGTPDDYFLVVTELVRHKRVEVALEAARRAGRKMKVVGAGPELRHLRERFRGHADLLGRVPDDELVELYAGALALVVPGVEEFGIAAVEAQAAGRPVVAAAAGGVLETVIPGKTGALVAPGDVEALTRALRQTPFESFYSDVIRANAELFSREAFQRGLTEEVDTVISAPDAAYKPPASVPSSVSVADPRPVGESA